MIRPDRWPEPPVHGREVGRKEGVVDRDPVGRPCRPAPLSAEPEASVAKSGSFEETGEVGRPVGAIEVADEKRRAAIAADSIGEDGELPAGLEGRGSLQGRGEVDEPDMAGLASKLDDRVDGRVSSFGHWH